MPAIKEHILNDSLYKKQNQAKLVYVVAIWDGYKWTVTRRGSQQDFWGASSFLMSLLVPQVCCL